MGVSERRRRERERRHASIVEAAERTFLREGFEASTMEQVATEAEVSKGTVYLYFESKHALMAAIGERWVGRLIDTLRPRLAAAPTGLDGVAAVLEAYRNHFAGRPDHCRLALGWINTGPPPEEMCGESFEGHRDRVRELVGMVVETIERGRADGSIRAELNPHLLAMQLWGSFLGVWMLVLNRERVLEKAAVPVDMDQMMPSFHETLLAGIAGPAANVGALPRAAGDE